VIRTTSYSVFVCLLLVQMAISCGKDEQAEYPRFVRRFVPSDTILSGNGRSDPATITDISTTESRVFVLDGPQALITCYSDAADPIIVFGERGAGPGCLGRPTYICCLSDSVLLISDLGSRSLERFTVNGAWIGRVAEWTGDPMIDLCPIDEEHMAACQVEWLEGPELRIETCVFSCDLSGRRTACFLSDTTSIDPARPTDALDASLFAYRIAAGGGRVFLFDRSDPEYSIRCFDQTGSYLYSIEMDVDMTMKTDEEIIHESSEVCDFLRSTGGSSDIIQFSYEPREWKEPVADMWVTGDGGQLWVQRGDLDGFFFDVFGTPDGRCIGQAEAIIDTSGIWNTDFFVADSSRMYLTLETQDFTQILMRLRPEPITQASD
jgi:hypothetical protein